MRAVPSLSYRGTIRGDSNGSSEAIGTDREKFIRGLFLDRTFRGDSDGAKYRANCSSFRAGTLTTIIQTPVAAQSGTAPVRDSTARRSCECIGNVSACKCYDSPLSLFLLTIQTCERSSGRTRRRNHHRDDRRSLSGDDIFRRRDILVTEDSGHARRAIASTNEV